MSRPDPRSHEVAFGDLVNPSWKQGSLDERTSARIEWITTLIRHAVAICPQGERADSLLMKIGSKTTPDELSEIRDALSAIAMERRNPDHPDNNAQAMRLLAVLTTDDDFEAHLPVFLATEAKDEMEEFMGSALSGFYFALMLRERPTPDTISRWFGDVGERLAAHLKDRAESGARLTPETVGQDFARSFMEAVSGNTMFLRKEGTAPAPQAESAPEPEIPDEFDLGGEHDAPGQLSGHSAPVPPTPEETRKAELLLNSLLSTLEERCAAALGHGLYHAMRVSGFTGARINVVGIAQRARVKHNVPMPQEG